MSIIFCTFAHFLCVVRECARSIHAKNTAYIILDDITTTGSSMMAGNEILLEKDVCNENIFNIAIGATVRDDDGEI